MNILQCCHTLANKLDDILGDVTDYINGVYKNTMSTKDANHSKIVDIAANFKFSNTTENDGILTAIL